MGISGSDDPNIQELYDEDGEDDDTLYRKILEDDQNEDDFNHISKPNSILRTLSSDRFRKRKHRNEVDGFVSFNLKEHMACLTDEDISVAYVTAYPET